MQSSKVDAIVDDVATQLIVQGFRTSDTLDGYVFIGSLVGDELDESREVILTPEDAHILSEEIRKHAEYSLGSKGE